MSCHFVSHRSGTLFIVTVLVFATFTSVFAQQWGEIALAKPPTTMAKGVFLPLVQSGLVVDAEPAGASLLATATVDSVDLLMIQTFPAQINVVVRGNLPDACTQIDAIEQQHNGNTIQLRIITRPQSAGPVCAAAFIPFEQTIALDLFGFAAGDYTVVLQSVQVSFTLTVDNVASTQVYLPLAQR